MNTSACMASDYCKRTTRDCLQGYFVLVSAHQLHTIVLDPTNNRGPVPAGAYGNYTTAVYTEPWRYVAEPEQNPIGSDDDFAAAPNHPQLNNGKLSWNDGQTYALCEFVFSILELSGGSDDNPRMWEDVAAKAELWGDHPVSAQELQEIYMQVVYAQAY